MEINLKQYKRLEGVDYLIYILIQTLVEDNEFGNYILKSKPSITKKLEALEYVRTIGGIINPTNKALKLLEATKEDKHIIIEQFNLLKKDYLKITRPSKLTPQTEKFITGRLKNYSKEDIMSVMELKFNEWANTGMQKYLRFETLLNATKFEGYIQEYETSKNNNISKFDFE